MVKYFSIIITVILTSFFFFPFYFTFMPTINTKMILALGGVIVFFLNMARNGAGKVNKELFVLSLSALSVSLVSFTSMTINETVDDSYLFYIVSMFVWLAAAYFVVVFMKYVHGKVSVELICFYLIAVCVSQCILALMIDSIPSVKIFIDSILYGYGFMGKNVDRLYGLGCALDVAGGRFAAILIMISFLLPRMAKYESKQKSVFLLLISYGIIAVVGNIIGRTTTVGIVLSLVYLVYTLSSDSVVEGKSKDFLVRQLFVMGLLFIIAVIFLYNTNPQWKSYLEFGFEGFFSLFEEGKWEVHSNNMLSGQFILPETLKSWIIGDGYMASTDIDPYYIGEVWHGFYKGTDVGYSRFLLYFGVIGLIAFSIFIIYTGIVCMKKLLEFRLMFLLLLLLNFIIWFKVSTDLFLVFTPFLCLAISKTEEKSLLYTE